MKRKRPSYGVTAHVFDHPAMTEAQKLIWEFCRDVRSGDQVPRENIEAVVERFEDWMMGRAKSLDHAFGLKTRGRRATTNSPVEIARRVEIASAVILEKERNPSLDLPIIFDSLVELYAEKSNFIQDCYEKYRTEGKEALDFLRRKDASPDSIVGVAIEEFLRTRRTGVEKPHTLIVNPPRNYRLPGK